MALISTDKTMATGPKFKHSELTDTIIGVFYDVYNELGFGFLESVYRKALKLALEAKGVKVEAEVPGQSSFAVQTWGTFELTW